MNSYCVTSFWVSHVTSANAALLFLLTAFTCYAAYPQALESEPVTIATTQKDKVEERRGRALHMNGGREQASDTAPSDWL